MRRGRLLVAAAVLLWVAAAEGQMRRVTLPAGSPEDAALQEIGRTFDPEERRQKLEAFLAEFAGNQDALFLGYWQLAQNYEAQGEAAQALAYGDKALEAVPDHLELLVAQAGLAQQTGDTARLLEYARRGAAAYHGIANAPRPEGLHDEEYETRVQRDQELGRPGYEFLEAAVFNLIVAEQDGATRMGYIELHTASFPASRYEEQVAQYAIYTLQQLNDPKRLLAYGERALKANPESMATLVMLAAALSEQPGAANWSRAVEYARKAIALAKAEEEGADEQRRAAAGVAHSALGYALLRQERTAQAIGELQKAAPLLKADAAAYSTVLYRLGYAHAKLNQLTPARAVLTEAAQIPGPFQQASRELLAKVNAARAKGQD
jgi:tetratricopeptide (TPR) repeat protein